MINNEKVFRHFGVYLADLPNIKKASVQNGCRPVIVVSNNAANNYSSLIIVIPLTSKSKKELPTHVKLKNNCLKNNCSLPKDSTALAEQVLTIDKSCIIHNYGFLKEEYSVLIIKALKIQLGICC